MVPDRGDAGRDAGREKRARRAHHRRRRFSRRHHVDLARRGRIAGGGAIAAAAAPTRSSASTNSAAAPAISPWPRRSSPTASPTASIVDARVGIGGAEATPRRITEAEALLNGTAARRRDFSRGGGSRRRRHRSARGHPDHRRIPSRSGARRHASRPGARRRNDGSHQGLRNHMGRTLDPATGGPRPGHRPGPLHRGSAGNALGALRAQRRRRGTHREASPPRRAPTSSPPPISRR